MQIITVGDTQNSILERDIMWKSTHVLELSQHYKKCHFSRGECERLLINITQDITIMKYKEKLITGVDSALKELNLVPSN